MVVALVLSIPGSETVRNAVASALNKWNSCDGAFAEKAPLIRWAGTGENAMIDVVASTAHGCGEYIYSSGDGQHGTLYLNWNDSACAGGVLGGALHELGHALGLDEVGGDGCLGHVMHEQSSVQNPASAECSKVSGSWITSAEEPGGGPPPPNTPLVLDLDGVGIVTSDVDLFPTAFDIDADGRVEMTGWTIEGDRNAFLWIDLNGNGQADDGGELFGSASALPDGETAPHRFAALAAYDRNRNGGNEDGRISPEDRVWRLLLLWVDANGDGLSTRDEVTRPSRERILSIDLDFVEVNAPDGAGNWRLSRSRFWVMGMGKIPVIRSVEDIAFKTTG